MPQVQQLLLIAAFCVGRTTCAFGCDFAVSTWQMVSVPKDQDSVEFRLWEHRANHSEHNWVVYRDTHRVCARLLNRHRPNDAPLPFTASAGPFSQPRAAVKVKDGWLVGFNRGEWGGALYWFSPDGADRYKISDHQIVDFIQSGDSVLAIQGLAHLSLSEGSILSVRKTSNARRWRVKTILTLPKAPEASAMHSNGALYIVLTDSFVSVDRARHLTTVHPNAAWGLLYPNSLVLDEANAKAYIGMRQFVAEVSLVDGTAKYGVPDEDYLNRLPKDVEDGIRKQHGG